MPTLRGWSTRRWPSSPAIPRQHLRQRAAEPVDAVLATPLGAARQAALYVAYGLACIRRAPRLYVWITCAYVTPALLAGFLAASVREPVVWQQALVLGLPWLTIVLGAVVIMVAVGYQARGQTVDLIRATRVGVRWVPRYVWTNVHTSTIFWVPIGTVLAVRDWQAQAVPVSGATEPMIDVLWWL